MNMPPVTKNIIIINALLFLGCVVATKYGINLTNWLGLHFVLSPDFKLHQLFTYMFMHGGFEHLFFNMFAVWMFGVMLERVWGPKRFLFYYVACGLGAALIQEVVQGVEYQIAASDLSPEMIALVRQEGAGILHEGMNYTNFSLGTFNAVLNGSTVGASGAVYAILLAFGMTFPNQPIYLYFLLPMKAKYFVILYAILELVLGFSQSADGIAHFAHLGGMLFGFIIIMYWRKKYGNGAVYY